MRRSYNEISQEEARHALASVDAFQQAGCDRGLPPRWFGWVMAIYGGLVITGAGYENLHDSMWVMVFPPIFLAYAMRKRMGAWVNFRPSIGTRILALLTIVGLAVFSAVSKSKMGLEYGPLLTGIVGFFTVLVAYEIKCRRVAGR